jgi:hypothetical protein
MRKTALIVASVIGLAFATSTSLEAQSTVASVALEVLVLDPEGDGLTRLGEGVRLMTAYEEERRVAQSFLGYTSFEYVGTVFDRPLPGLVPLHRYRNRDSGDYFYTTDEAEGARAVSRFNYIPEGVCCYIAPTQLAGTVPLFRLLSPEGGFHYYTTRVYTREELQYAEGYDFEGIQGYVWGQRATLPAQ